MTKESMTELAGQNLLRDKMLVIAEDLEAGNLSSQAGAQELRRLASETLDLIDDLEIQDDLAFGLITPLLLTQTQRSDAADPVEQAIASLCRLRDKTQALRIAGKEPGQRDLDAYAEAIDTLHQTLDQHRSRS